MLQTLLDHTGDGTKKIGDVIGELIYKPETFAGWYGIL